MFLFQFLQIVTDGTTEVIEQVKEADQSVSLYELVMAGGWTMIPLAIFSIAAIYIFIERFMNISKASKSAYDFIPKVKEKVLSGKVSEAISLVENIDSPSARMIQKGLHRLGSPLKTIEASVENVGKLEINKMEKNLSILATIAGAGPMVGFLGTVLGMIQAFISIAQQEGSISPKLLSAGIYEAMITTAAGLIVGIIAYVAYNYLTARIQKIIHDMEYSAIEFIELLQEPTK